MKNSEKLWKKAFEKHEEANFLQAPEWAKMNELIGNEAVTEVDEDGNLCVMYVKNAKRGRYLEIPCGPLIDWEDTEVVARFFGRIKEIAKEKHCIFVRLRPQLVNTEENRGILEKIGCVVAPMHLAAEHTVMIDLTRSEDEMLAAMRRQTRYEVRKAEKMGIVVKTSNSLEIFREFQKVQAETAARQHFIPPNLDTLLAEREAFSEKAKIYVAYTGDDDSEISEEADKGVGISAGALKPIAYGLILGAGREADYFEAASTDLNRKMPGAYALLWQAMKDLKAEGYERFNLWGIAPPNQPEHRYAGVTTFKTGFGGEVVEFVPAYDLVIDPMRYKLNVLVETVRKKRRHL